MKKSIKRVLCLFCALLMLVFAMTACGGNEEPVASGSSGSSTASGTNGSGPTTVTTSEISGYTGTQWENFDPYEAIQGSKGKTVRFATWIDHTETEGAKALANFENDTGLKVETYLVASPTYVNDLMIKMAAGDKPDVFVNNERLTNFPNTLQLAAPINKVSTVNLQEPIWDQTLINSATIDGNVYLVNTLNTPWTGGNMTFYNKRLFEENGFKTPADYYAEGKWTWDNLKKCAKDIVALGDEYSGVSLEVDILTDSLGTSFIKYDYNTDQFYSGIDDKNLLAGYQWYAEARDEKLLDGSMQKFVEGTCGMLIRGPYGLKNNGYFIDMNFDDIGFTHLPTLEEGQKPVASGIYRMYGIIDGAPNANEAGYFLRYWLDAKNYDLDNTFISIEAGNFYYELTNLPAEQKYFNFENACCALIGEESSYSAFINGPRFAAPAGVKTAIDETANVVNKAIEEANKIVQEKIVAVRDKYK